MSAAVPNGRWVKFIPQFDAITGRTMRAEAGRALPASDPGFGIDWDWERIEDLAELRLDVRARG